MSLAFMRAIHWWPVNSARKGPVTQKMFPFNDVIMDLTCYGLYGAMHIMSSTFPNSIQI